MTALQPLTRGTSFGSIDREPPRSIHMAAIESHDGTGEHARAPRGRERRLAFADLLASLARGLDRRHDPALLRGAFEQMLRRVVPVRSIRLRDLGSRWAQDGQDAALEALTIDVPGRGP